MYLTQPLHKAARECPRAIATICRDRRQSYAEFTTRVAKLAGALQGLGVQPDDRVAMLSLNSDRYAEYLYGVLWAGGVVNPVNVRWSPREVAYSLDDCDTRILLVDDAFAPMVEALRAQSASLATVVFAGDGACPVDMLEYEQLLTNAGPVADAMRQGDDLAGILYTGGTTGEPKGVMLSHANFYLDAVGSQTASQRPAGAVALQTTPSFHVAGVQGLMSLTMRHGTHVFLPAFEPAAVLAMIERERVAEAFLVPTMLRVLLDHPDFARRDLSSLELLIYGASPMDTALLERALDELPGVEFAQAYGMTELAPTVSVLPPSLHTAEGRTRGKLMSAGQPLGIAEIRIVDAEDSEVRPGTIGEIAVRGPTVMQGYWNKPEQTAEALRGGWMHTGDLGYMDEEGFVFVVDRMKDMVVSGGENVYSAEVEDVILQLPQVAQCAVIGVPDDKWGERVHAVLVLTPDAELEYEQLAVYCKQHIAGYKCPRSIEFVDEMPMSGAGKLLKFKLREPHWRDRSRQVG